jgi:hypothetical protein
MPKITFFLSFSYECNYPSFNIYIYLPLDIYSFLRRIRNKHSLLTENQRGAKTMKERLISQKEVAAWISKGFVPGVTNTREITPDGIYTSKFSKIFRRSGRFVISGYAFDGSDIEL